MQSIPFVVVALISKQPLNFSSTTQFFLEGRITLLSQIPEINSDILIRAMSFQILLPTQLDLVWYLIFPRFSKYI